MLYVTTRNRLDTYTVIHTLTQNRAGDGGFWIPFRGPRFSAEQIEALIEQSFSQTMAQMLNTIFGTKLTGWDVEFCIGRYPVRFREITGKVIIVEPWHNPQWTFENVVLRLADLVKAETVGSWMHIAVRICVLFAVYGELLRQNLLKAGDSLDVSVLSGNFIDPMSVLYARQWGLPVENVVCCCNENNSVWNLICHGEMRTDTKAVSTCIPEADVTLPDELERFIAACGSQEEVEDYLEACRTGRMYVPADYALSAMRKGLYVSVVSSHRIGQTIGGVFASHRILLGPEGALNYAGLQDYRARKGQIRLSLVMTGESPSRHAAFVAEAAGLEDAKIKDYL